VRRESILIDQTLAAKVSSSVITSVWFPFETFSLEECFWSALFSLQIQIFPEVARRKRTQYSVRNPAMAPWLVAESRRGAVQQSLEAQIHAIPVLAFLTS